MTFETVYYVMISRKGQQLYFTDKGWCWWQVGE
jgi:hypothetical protein